MKEKIKTAIFQSLMCMGEEKYPIGDDFYIRYFDGNEWGDDMIENRGIQVVYNEYPWEEENDEVYAEYKFGDYMHGTLGLLVFYGDSLIDDMVKDVMKDCFDYVEESDVVEDFLAF